MFQKLAKIWLNIPKNGKIEADLPKSHISTARAKRSGASAWALGHALSMVTWYHQNIVDLLIEQTNFAFYSIQIGLETPDYNASLSSNWTELDWTRTEIGKIPFFTPCARFYKLKTNIFYQYL